MADVSLFDKVRIGIASPEDIRAWSHGEVKKPETINYRTFKPERDGLFCERIFGPVKDWECHCGRYKKVKYKGIVCERCGVEVTRQKVRRERMGHIELAAPVSHIWYLKGVPSPLGLILDISPRLLEKVIYFASFIVTEVDRASIQGSVDEMREAIELEKIEIKANTEIELENLRQRFGAEIEENREIWTEDQIKDRQKNLQERLKQQEKEADDRSNEFDAALELISKIEKRQLIDEDKYRAIDRLLDVASRRLGKDFTHLLQAGIGAIAVRELLKEIDLEKLAKELTAEILTTQGPRRARAIKRLEIAKALIDSKSRPEWMILEVVPVISPELRPMVQLDGGRFATSDLNDLYRRIINRNNRLKKIIEIKAPESIINHEKRLLQEAVDALIDNGRRTRPVVGSNNRPLKSLSDMLKGKEGRFRKNLLGKRVDYSGRSVIVVGPHLKLHQCGLPKEMALELFKPFVMKTLVERGATQNIKTAKRMIDRMHPLVWDGLEKVIKEHPVLLNRAPTLHRLGIQAFEPVLVDGKAIQIHPLVCHAYNADFDGDQMAVHVPLSASAQAEARILMLSTHNLFSPADGQPIVAPIQDIVLGSYYLTQIRKDLGVYPQTFASPEEAQFFYEQHEVTLNQLVNVRLTVNGDEEPSIFETTVGRLIMNDVLPPALKYTKKYLTTTLTKKTIAELVSDCREQTGHERTIQLLDDLKEMGFLYATKGAVSISMTDMDSPEKRIQIIRDTEEACKKIDQQYNRGHLTAPERKQRVLDAWMKAYDNVSKAIIEAIDQTNPLFIITDSGARGSMKQVTQLAGMRGLMSDPFGNIIEDLPVRSNFHEGLSVFEYFVSTHGARKGLADTALRTADAGYLTRRLVDVAQDVIIRNDDCNTTEGITVSRINLDGELIEKLGDRIRGRTSLNEVRDPSNNEVILNIDDIISDEQAKRVTLVDNVFAKEFEAVKGKGREAIKEFGRKYEEFGFVFDEHDALAVAIRSTLTCELQQGVCALCYGRDMATGRKVEIGMAVGIVAAQSIGEPGTQLTMRTFHTGGVAAATTLVGVKDVKRQTGAALREIMSDQDRGLLQFTGEEMLDLRTEQQRIVREITQGTTSAEFAEELANQKPAPKASTSGKTAEKESEDRSKKIMRSWMQKLVKLLESEIGGILRVEELFEARHPKGEAIITEFEGQVAKVVKADRGRWVAIRTSIDTADSTSAGKAVADDVVDPDSGDVIVHGAAEITEKALVRMRNAGINHIDVIELILVPYRGTLMVQEGDYVRASDRLTLGPLDPHKVLALRGVRGIQDYIVREIQTVYKGQGVDINDKHVEIIARQMLRKRKVKDPGDTMYLPGQVVDRFVFEHQNEQIIEMLANGEKFQYTDQQTGEEMERDPKTATADWVLLGITEASLATESFLSAASFQKTTRVLTEAAVRGKKDDLVGLKENVIIGRLIPAGTGFPAYR
ncbi:MAG: DNA-directed RNA polymerase subunit beta', partial [bacterium]